MERTVTIYQAPIPAAQTATRNSIVTNGCLIVTAARPTDLTAFDTLRIRSKPRVSSARPRPKGERRIYRPRSLLLFHEQRHPVNHTRSAVLITREHVSHGGLTLRQCGSALWVPIFRTRVARYRPRSTCARKPGGDFYSSIRARSFVVRAAYMEVTVVLWPSTLSSPRESSQLRRAVLFFLRAFHHAQRRYCSSGADCQVSNRVSVSNVFPVKLPRTSMLLLTTQECFIVSVFELRVVQSYKIANDEIMGVVGT